MLCAIYPPKGVLVRICGTAIDGSAAVVVLIETAGSAYQIIDTGISKIILDDDISQESIKNFFDTIQAYIRDNHIDLIALKSRLKKGDYAGGAVGFKIEALLQLTNTKVMLISPPRITSKTKDFDVKSIDGIYRYQIDSLLVAYAANAIISK